MTLTVSLPKTFFIFAGGMSERSMTFSVVPPIRIVFMQVLPSCRCAEPSRPLWAMPARKTATESLSQKSIRASAGCKAGMPRRPPRRYSPLYRLRRPPCLPGFSLSLGPRSDPGIDSYSLFLGEVQFIAARLQSKRAKGAIIRPHPVEVPMKYARSGRHTFTVKLLWAAFLGGLFVAWSLKALSPLARVWDLDQTTQPGQLTVYNTSLKGGYYGMPVEMADLNGDGFMDLVLAPMAANGGNGSRLESGEVYVYPGNGQIEGTIDRGAFAGSPPGLTVWGAREGDFLGTELYTADVNGDGVQDLLISAQNYDGIDGTRDSAGGAFIVLGRSDLLDGSQVIDTLAPPKGVIRIVGAHPGDRLGILVEAGDLDGDGFSDILLGADQYPADSPASDNYHRGMVVVIYGRSQFPDVIDLSKPIDGVSFI